MSRFIAMLLGVVLAASAAEIGASQAEAARPWRQNQMQYRSSRGYTGYLSPYGPSSRYNEFRIPFYMRADRRVLGLLP